MDQLTADDAKNNVISSGHQAFEVWNEAALERQAVEVWKNAPLEIQAYAQFLRDELQSLTIDLIGKESDGHFMITVRDAAAKPVLFGHALWGRLHDAIYGWMSNQAPSPSSRARAVLAIAGVKIG